MLTTEALERAIATLDANRPSLGDAVVDIALGPLRRKLSALRTAHSNASEPQRKTVTVLFASVADFAQWSETRDADELMAMMEALWAQLDAIIEARGGVIDKHVGGTLMALWGATATREDDTEQAISAALAMQAATQNLPSKIRIGLNTGPVLLGLVGTTSEFTAMGDTVNVAARLEQSASPGKMLISNDSYRQVRGLFDVQPRQPLMVKGKREPLQVFEVLQLKPLALRLGARGVEGIETKLIGREAEMAQLQALFRASADNGTTQTFTIISEAGVGKSRLLYDFTIWLDLLPIGVNYLKGRASQHTEFSPYALLRDLFAFRFEIRESDDVAMVQRKIEAGFAPFFTHDPIHKTHEMRAHFIGQLLGYNFNASPHLAGVREDARQIRSRALYYLVQYFKTLTANAPTLLFLEDIHWADTPSLEAIKHLIRECPNLRLLVVALARPPLFERALDWGEWPNHVQLELQPLAPEESRLLTANILQRVDYVPPELFNLVVARAEGNPFYVEELIKMLIEDGVIVRADDAPWRVVADKLAALRVPPTLTGILQARSTVCIRWSAPPCNGPRLSGACFGMRRLARYILAPTQPLAMTRGPASRTKS